MLTSPRPSRAGPLFCGPKSKYPFTGFWDFNKECNKPWADPPEYCTEYDGQLAGGIDNSAPVANAAGRTDVEGCCFWGRGVIQSTGVCNFGKLNYFLGAGAAEDGREARYPDVNFCERPDAICASEEYKVSDLYDKQETILLEGTSNAQCLSLRSPKELKWIAGYFYWIER